MIIRFDATSLSPQYVASLTLISSKLERLLNTILVNNLLVLPSELNIVYTDDCSGHTVDATTVASCDPDNAVIYLNPVFYKQIAENLLHELIHVEQAQIGWLTVTSDGVEWFGKLFDEPTNEQEYLNLPWERDAWRRTPEIMKQVKSLWRKDSAAIKSECYLNRSQH